MCRAWSSEPPTCLVILENSSMVGNWRKGTLLAPFQPGVMPVPAGSCGCKSDLEKGTPSGKVGPSLPYITA